MYRVLFVCTGNTCRSPMAVQVLRRGLAESGLAAEVASAGLRARAEGGPADPRAQEVLTAHGYRSGHSARQFEAGMFDQYDLIIALDTQHERVLRGAAPDAVAAGRVCLLGSFDPAAGAGWDIPDPVGGDISDYERALRLIRSAMPGVIAKITAAISTCPAAGGSDCG